MVVATGIAGLRGRLPGCEPAPYIIRFTEDRPNPLYRRVCYTTAWGEVVAFALLNIAGLAYAVVTGEWRLKQMYVAAYFPIAGTMWALGAFGRLPRVKPSTQGEGHERRYFYGSVWAVMIAQPVLWVMWKVAAGVARGDVIKLAVFVGILAFVGRLVAPRAAPAYTADRSRANCGVGLMIETSIDALTSPTLKHLRERWWNDDFTDFLAETLRPRPGNRILDVGCGEGTAEVRIGRLHVSQVRMVGVDLMIERVDGGAARRPPVTTSVSASRRPTPVTCHFDDGVFDSTFCVAVLQHIGDVDTAVAELARVTRARRPRAGGRARQRARYPYAATPAGRHGVRPLDAILFRARRRPGRYI